MYAFKNYLLNAFTTFPCLFRPRNTRGTGGVVGRGEDEHISPYYLGRGVVGAVSDVWMGVAVTPACCQRCRGSCAQLLVEAAQVGYTH